MGSPLNMNLIEDLEERALAQATHKLLCWFRYVGDIFVICPQVTEKLERFLNRLKGFHRNIQFTMETETDGHLPFPDVNIYRRLDGSLGQKVY
jgi:hypothetical protein